MSRLRKRLANMNKKAESKVNDDIDIIRYEYNVTDTFIISNDSNIDITIPLTFEQWDDVVESMVVSYSNWLDKQFEDENDLPYDFDESEDDEDDYKSSAVGNFASYYEYEPGITLDDLDGVFQYENGKIL